MIDMKKLFIPLMILLTVATVSAQDQNKILLYNVQIIDVETGKIQKNAAILIENNTIKAIGESNKLKRSAGDLTRIDGAGKYLIPGLWDMHVHLEGAELIDDNKALLPVFLAYGITTVRDCASD